MNLLTLSVTTIDQLQAYFNDTLIFCWLFALRTTLVARKSGWQTGHAQIAYSNAGIREWKHRHTF